MLALTGFSQVRQNLKIRAAELEQRIRERAEVVKHALREFRETQRAAGSRGLQRTRERARLLKKKLDVEKANSEYIQLQKELDQLRSRMQAGK
jgi:predicted  nucleic acid-binding Zn-ribbon protein